MRIERRKERFAELDLIRFFAALAVVVYHYKSKYIESLGDSPDLAQAIYSVTKFGYLGIDLFFTISGFVIFASALDRTGFQFAVSRITRIYPTLWVCVSMTALTALALQGTASGISAAQWLANLTLFSRQFGIDYVDGVYWTLEVEVRFYFCIFALLVLNLITYYRYWIPLWLAATVSFLLTKQPFFLGWLVSPEYSSYFIAGIIFFLARRDGYRWFHVAILLPTLAVSAAYAYQSVGTFARDVTSADRAIAAGIVCAIYLLFYLVSIRRFTLRGSAFILGIGGMTYPLYLLHNRAGKDIYDALYGSMPPLLLIFVVAGLMLAASWCVHAYLERNIADRLKYYLFAAAQRVSALRQP